SNWAGVAHCESGGNWALANGNGYYGGLQFNVGTWRAYGGTGMPNETPAWYQATIAERIRVQSGLQHWPGCGAYYG
ncbi:MAG TPA: transglycosylase family protein, partial [Acidimicrobiales bacterium]